LISALIAPVFFFVDGTTGIIMGVILWGIGMGAQESILKAVISMMVSKEKRATAYGVFYTVFGSAWFLGSVAIGWLYGFNILYVVIFSTLMELLAGAFLIIYRRKIGATNLKEV
jgi:MFS family permease